MEQFLQVGAITSTHGIRGEVKVFPTTDDPARFKKLKKVILDTGKRQIDMEIQSVRFFKQFVIVKFKGIDNINDVEQYKGSSLFVSRENAVSLEENEYYIGRSDRHGSVYRGRTFRNCKRCDGDRCERSIYYRFGRSWGSARSGDQAMY